MKVFNFLSERQEKERKYCFCVGRVTTVTERGFSILFIFKQIARSFVEMSVDINMQLRHLSFGKIMDLVPHLEPPSDKDWKALIKVMPEGRYSRQQVDMIQVTGKNGTQYCTEILLRDLCQLCVTVKELGIYLKKIKNYEALSALDWPSEPVVIKTQPKVTVLSEGNDLRLKVVATGYPLPEYRWYKNNEIIIDEEIYEFMIPNISQADEGKYKCQVSNEVNSVTSNEVQVRVSRGPPKKSFEEQLPDLKPVITVHPESAHILPGQHYHLRCAATGEQPMTYLWYKNGQPLLNSNTPILELRLFGEQDVGSYNCMVTNEYGADASMFAELAVGQLDREVRREATDKVALLIGNQDYTAHFPHGFQGQGTLKRTIADTQTLGSLLHRDDMGFNVLSFANLSRYEMQKAVMEYLSLLSEGCYAVFYFSGHGFEVNGKHYLVPVDAPADWTQEDAICIQWVLESIWKRRPQLTVILLDMCRMRPPETEYYEEYDFPVDLKIVMGFATCSQSESYERVDDENGIYMKYLKKHICRDVKIEDILHDVTTEVGNETSDCEFTGNQRPEYYSKGGGYFSLRDPVRPHGNLSAQKWLELHKLPEKRILEFEKGVKVEVRFEHRNWLTNTINIVVAVIDKGAADYCHAYIYQLPNDLQRHFSLERPDAVCARSRPQRPVSQNRNIVIAERSIEMFHLQRLHGNLPVTIALEAECKGEKQKIYKVEVFSAKDFGLAEFFQTTEI